MIAATAFAKTFPYEKSERTVCSRTAKPSHRIHHQEIVLSGGDPLALSNDSLRELFQRLALIKHVQRIRFHTRFPIGIPERIDEGLLLLLKKQPQQIIFVIHVNHPRELDEDI
jgi:L-lysine 2,3-aminomutase